ncbi:DNRLRE domain-containing protein [Streptomyces sp. NPDC004732]|uniref:DNRLRE domain-containing protein n=1 Tax=Streptomyces sp. NPDC004732 TaxID=3154290 RepID=UPI0033BC3387
MRTRYRRLGAGLVAAAVVGAVLPQAASARTAEVRPEKAGASASAADTGGKPPERPRIPRTPPRKYADNAPEPEVTYGAGGTVLGIPTVVHGTGAELSWPEYTGRKGDAPVGYQLHRSTRPGFKPTRATLVAPLGKGATSYKDTTAEPTRADSATETGRRYSYRILVETRDGRLLASPVRRVGVPKAGHTVRVLRAGQSDATLSAAEPGANLNGKWLSAGSGDGAYGTTRAALRIPTSGLPKKATVLQADLRLWASGGGGPRLLELGPLRREFAEKSVTWKKAGAGTPWRAGGGDSSAAVSDTTEQDGTYAWDVTSLTRQWAKRPGDNNGVLLKAAGGHGTVRFASSEARDEARRPQLRVITAEPTPWDTYYAPDTPTRMSEDNTYPVDVTVTNTTTAAWPAGERALSYKWTLPDGTDATTADNQLKADVPALAPGASATVKATVRSPYTADGNRRSGYTLTWDILNKADNSWLSEKPGIGGLAQTTAVEDPTADRVGLEKQHAYTGKNTGAGSTLMGNLGSGNAVWSYNSFGNPGRGINTFARFTYNAQDTSDSLLGHGWSAQAAGPLRLGATLDFHPDTGPGEAYVVDGDGTQHLFRKQGDGSWKPSAGYHYRLTAKPDVTSVCRTGSPEVPDAWTLTRPDGTRFLIGCDGYLTSVVDKNGNTQTYVYELRDSGNRRVKFLTEIKDPTARTSLKVEYYRAGDATYEYIDDKGEKATGKDLWNPRIYDHVKSMTDVSGRKISFHYTAKGLLGRLTDGDGAAQPKAFSFSYDAAQGNKNTKLTKVTDPRGHATDVEYGDGPESSWSTKTITDRKRATTGFTYAAAAGGGTETRITDAEKHTTTYTTDGQDRPVKITNAKSGQTRLAWDGEHNVTLLEEDNGSMTAKTAYCYDEKTGYPLWERSAEENKEGVPPAADCAPGRFPSHSVRYEYKTRADGYAADLVKKTSAESRVWQFGHDAKGNLKTVTDPKGVASAVDGDYTTSYEYDSYGQLTRATDANGNATAYGDFVAAGYPRTTTDALAKVTTTEYDARGQVTEVVDALKKKTTQTYDAFGRPLVSKVPKDQAAGVFITTPAPDYDANDNVTKATAPNGAVSTATYDDADQLVSATAPKDTATSGERKTAYTYDSVGNLKTTTEPKGTATPADPDDYVTTNNYDEIYQLTSVVNAKRDKVSYVYDGAGNAVRVIDPKKNATTDPDDYTTKTDYDMNHRVVAVTDAAGRTVTQAYDKDSLVVSTTDAEKNKTVNHYDERGALAVVETPHAADTVRTTKFGYDQAGNRIKVFTPRGVATEAEPDDFVAETTYDPLNRPARQIQPYDPKDPRYNKKVWTETTYDAVGRVEKVSAPPSSGETTRNDTTYGYYDNGWVKTAQDVWDIRTTYEYNDLGQQAARQLTSAGGSTSRTMRWGFYPDGKLKSRDDDGVPVGANELVASGAQARTGKGTQASPHVWKLNVAKAGTYTAYAEGAAGKWTKLGTDTYKKGENAELKAAADTVKLVRDHSADADTERKRFAYAYDVNGNLTSIDDTSTGTKVDAYTMTYTGLNQVDKVVEALAGQEKKATSYTYDANGQPETLNHPEQYAKYTYDLRELVKTVSVGKSASDAAPKVTSYDYTDRGERKTETKANKNTVGYTYYLDGALKSQTEKKPDGSTLVASHAYAYDANGNKAQDVAKKMNADDHAKYLSSTTDYTYDPVDRLAKSARTGHGAGTETYVHDDNANVVSQTVKGKTTTFGYDRNRLLETKTGGVTASHTYDAFGRQDSVTVGGKVIERNSYDGFDRVRQNERADTSTGALKTTKYAYDPLDRTSSRTDSAGKSTDYTYLGTSGEVLGEEVSGKLTKSYQYGPWGERLSQVKHAADGSAGESAFYGYNSHTDVETLTDKDGDTKATYGYSAYGSDDPSDFTGIDKPDAGDPAKTAYNPYRFNSKRWDAASGTYDMGFRDYSPGLNRFTTRDMYNGAAADMRLGADALTGNRYAFTGGNPISHVELDGHLPCAEGIADSCGGGGPALSRGVLADGRSAIYDEYGIGHIVAKAGDNDASKLALKALNDDLKKAGAFSDGSGKGTGEQYLAQDDTKPLLADSGSFTDKDGNLRFNGTTSDFIRVSYENGSIVDVLDFDATSSKDGKAMKLLAGDINNKMNPERKGQTNNVVYVAQSADQAKAVASHYASDPRVRVLHPSSGFDSAPVFNGATGGAHTGRVSSRIGGRFLGVAGFAMPFAQSNSYIRSFGVGRGLMKMGAAFFDPFGVADSVSPPSNSGGICDPSSGNCA